AARTGEVPAAAPAPARAETLMGATATYSPPLIKRPWLSYVGACFAGVLVTAAVLHLVRATGPEPLPDRARVAPNALSAGPSPRASSPDAHAPPTPSASAAPAAVPAPAPKPSVEPAAAPPAGREGPKADERVGEPAADASARRRAPKPGPSGPRPAGPKGSGPNPNPPKPGGTDWGID
ncbi:MAG TPA: hypothetical protein VFS00_16490, partial [Polyangiaceae bacterium]|nr:hypothetical protein [Polyangiaceae bacterium]